MGWEGEGRSYRRKDELAGYYGSLMGDNRASRLQDSGKRDGNKKSLQILATGW